MTQTIDYQKQLTDMMYINLHGPQEPDVGMNGGELLRGFLAELYRVPDEDVRSASTAFVSSGTCTTANKKDRCLSLRIMLEQACCDREVSCQGGVM